jgi:glucose-1-phosphate cytidylyltransferase
MVEVGGRPILWHIMKLYAHHGVRDFILALGYKAHAVKEYFLNYEAMNADFTVTLGRARRGAPTPPIEYHGGGHGEAGIRVTLADTGGEAMTGARVKRAARYLGKKPSTFAVTYGDGVADLDLRAVLKTHRAHGGLATITGVRPPSRFGELVHRDGRVARFREKPQVGQGLINGGFFFFEPGFLRYLSDDDACVLEREPLERCARDGALHVHEHAGYWQCMDTYRDWERLEEEWKAGKAPWKLW